LVRNTAHVEDEAHNAHPRNRGDEYLHSGVHRSRVSEHPKARKRLLLQGCNERPADDAKGAHKCARAANGAIWAERIKGRAKGALECKGNRLKLPSKWIEYEAERFKAGDPEQRHVTLFTEHHRRCAAKTFVFHGYVPHSSFDFLSIREKKRSL